MENIIETHALTHAYKKGHNVLHGIHLRVPKGSIYGFLGPNGAGKSTTIGLLTGAIPDRDHAVSLFGKSISTQIPHVFRRMGCIVESPTLYSHLTGREHLELITLIKKVPSAKVTELLNLVDLTKAADSKAKSYSLGMKQRLALAMTLVGEPELLFLDEPVNGLDPSGILHIRQLLKRLNQEFGTSIFISSHLLPEVEKLCTHVSIIHKGELKFQGTMGEIKSAMAGHKVRIRTSERADVILEGDFVLTSQSDHEIEVLLKNPEDTPKLIQTLVSLGVGIYEVTAVRTLEDWFFDLTQSQQQDV